MDGNLQMDVPKKLDNFQSQCVRVTQRQVSYNVLPLGYLSFGSTVKSQRVHVTIIDIQSNIYTFNTIREV